MVEPSQLWRGAEQRLSVGWTRVLVSLVIYATFANAVTEHLPLQQLSSREGTCPVTHLVLTKIDKASGKLGLSLTQVAKHIGGFTGLSHFDTKVKNHLAAKIIRPDRVRWVGSKSHYFSCWDGRAEYETLGTPGGDLGEFVLAMCALEDVKKTDIVERSTIRAYLEDYISDRDRFYMHSDHFTLAKLATAAQVQDPLHPKTREERERVLDFLPQYIGCEHLSNMIEHPHQYGCRRELVESVTQAAFDLVINPSTDPQLKSKILFAVYQGYPREEQAFVNVISPLPSNVASQHHGPASKVPKGVLPPTPEEEKEDREAEEKKRCMYQAPLVSPFAEGKAMFVYHPVAVYEARAAMAQWMTHHEHQDTTWQFSYFRVLQEKGTAAVRVSKDLVAPNLHTYVAHFVNRS